MNRQKNTYFFKKTKLLKIHKFYNIIFIEKF